MFNRYADPKLTSEGVSAPQSMTDHTVWSSRSHNAMMMKSISRVKSGKRKRYERIRDGFGMGNLKVEVARLGVAGVFEGMVLVEVETQLPRQSTLLFRMCFGVLSCYEFRFPMFRLLVPAVLFSAL